MNKANLIFSNWFQISIERKKSNNVFLVISSHNLFNQLHQTFRNFFHPHPHPIPLHLSCNTFNVLLSLSLSDMFHIALAIHGRVPRSETVRRIRYVFFVRDCRNRSDRLTIAIQNWYISNFIRFSKWTVWTYNDTHISLIVNLINYVDKCSIIYSKLHYALSVSFLQIWNRVLFLDAIILTLPVKKLILFVPYIIGSNPINLTHINITLSVIN